MSRPVHLYAKRDVAQEGAQDRCQPTTVAACFFLALKNGLTWGGTRSGRYPFFGCYASPKNGYAYFGTGGTETQMLEAIQGGASRQAPLRVSSLLGLPPADCLGLAKEALDTCKEALDTCKDAAQSSYILNSGLPLTPAQTARPHCRTVAENMADAIKSLRSASAPAFINTCEQNCRHVLMNA